jgi:LAS superfamily LD-carboxypeptidase LdcB
MGTAPAIRERRFPKGRARDSRRARSGPRRKGRSARALRHSGERRRRRLAVFLALLFMSGVGHSIVGLAEEQTASSAGPYTPATGSSNDNTRKVASPAATCDDLGVLVDRSHSLSPNYVPKNLVPLREYGISTLGSEALRREAAEHLGRLVQDAAADGEKLAVASAYRSY